MSTRDSTPSDSEEGSSPLWHECDVATVAERVRVVPSEGLSAVEVAQRLAVGGPNQLTEARRRSAARLLVSQFADVMVLLLAGAAVVAGVVGEPQDTIAIVAILALNAALGFVQEFRAERALAALRAMTAPTARVRRAGTLHTIPAAGVVVGDVVLLEPGAIVPADLRLFDAPNLRVDESALTGESQAVDKQTGPLPVRRTSLGDRVNMAYKSTLVTYGRGAGVVVATGMRTELGCIAQLLEGADATRTPLQQRLKRFASQLAVVVLLLCAVILGIGLLRGEEPLLMFLTAVSLAVAAMPEALPAVVTVSLALGARRMVSRNALVRHLPAVETLGSVTYICADKTGTLTQNRMEVAAVRRPPFGPAMAEGTGFDSPGEELLRAIALNSDATVAADGRAEGESTEAALLQYAHDAGAAIAVHRQQHPRQAELPFSSERGRMSTLHAAGHGGPVLVMKGAPERVLDHCQWERQDGIVTTLDRTMAERAAESMAASGLRVLAFAVRDVGTAAVELSEACEAEMVLLGLVGLLDPLRPEAEGAVAECRRAGITVTMITGDHPATAAAIARQLSIVTLQSPGAVTGEELERMDDATLQERVDELRVYARVVPEQKIRIVRALQGRGEFVAMTGDGVNDAPALRQADIGIAMGRAGTDVAREAADMVLVDDNFASIVAAVHEGRRIYDNVRKFIRYVLTGNSAEIWLLFLAPFVGLPLPLLPIHILWINLVTDGLPGLALAVEPAERGIMQRPPRPPDESVFVRGLWQHTLWVGMLMGGVSLFTQGWAFHTGSMHWQSMTFTVLALSQLGHVLAVRSERDSLVTQGLGSNRLLTLAVTVTVLLQLATLYVPIMQEAFKTEPLTAAELLLCLALSSVTFLAVEGEKLLVRRGVLHGERGDVTSRSRD